MKTSLSFLIACLLPFSASFAGSATWKLDPTSNDWNTAQNWTPETVPDQITDVATFGVSNVTNVSITSPGGISIAGITFNPGASPYSVSGLFGLLGAGVVNNSGIIQNFDITTGGSFGGNATAGTGVIYTNYGRMGGDQNYFTGSSNAGTATFIFKGDSAGRSLGLVQFVDTSSAASSTLVLEAGDTLGGRAEFLENSTADNSTITVESGAVLDFEDDATGGSATLVVDGGIVYFQIRSDGQQAGVQLTNGGVLNLNGHDPAANMSIGSLGGDSTGVMRLGPGQLTVGGNGLSTTFDGQIFQSGSLVKTGNERLILTGANTYGGGTTITGGTLLVKARTGSATSNGPVQVNAGTLGGWGTIAGAVTVGMGSGSGAFLSPGATGPAHFAIANPLTFKADGKYKCELSLAAHGRADQVSASGVTIESGAQFMFRAKGNHTLPLGTTFTVINNTAATPISGTFGNLPDGSTLVAGSNTLQVSYEGGDGNDLTLTVGP